MYLDAKNVYEWAMSRKLSVKNHKWMTPEEIQYVKDNILNTETKVIQDIPQLLILKYQNIYLNMLHTISILLMTNEIFFSVVSNFVLHTTGFPSSNLGLPYGICGERIDFSRSSQFSPATNCIPPISLFLLHPINPHRADTGGLVNQHPAQH